MNNKARWVDGPAHRQRHLTNNNNNSHGEKSWRFIFFFGFRDQGNGRYNDEYTGVARGRLLLLPVTNSNNNNNNKSTVITKVGESVKKAHTHE